MGYLVVSHVSGRQFFVDESSPFVQTQFSGSVSKCYEVESLVGSKALGSALKNNSSSSGSSSSSRRSPGGADGGEDSDEEDEEQCVVMFEGRLLRYHRSRPMALKTCRISALKLEAQWQRRELGELSGEVSYKMKGWDKSESEHPRCVVLRRCSCKTIARALRVVSERDAFGSSCGRRPWQRRSRCFSRFPSSLSSRFFVSHIRIFQGFLLAYRKKCASCLFTPYPCVSVISGPQLTHKRTHTKLEKLGPRLLGRSRLVTFIRVHNATWPSRTCMQEVGGKRMRALRARQGGRRCFSGDRRIRIYLSPPSCAVRSVMPRRCLKFRHHHAKSLFLQANNKKICIITYNNILTLHA